MAEIINFEKERKYASTKVAFANMQKIDQALDAVGRQSLFELIGSLTCENLSDVQYALSTLVNDLVRHHMRTFSTGYELTQEQLNEYGKELVRELTDELKDAANVRLPLHFDESTVVAKDELSGLSSTELLKQAKMEWFCLTGETDRAASKEMMRREKAGEEEAIECCEELGKLIDTHAWDWPKEWI